MKPDPYPQQKQQHLGQAIAFLNPVQWDEPFGIVTVEALACGTPVLACPRGELPFIVEEGVTGYLSSRIETLAEAVQKVASLSRQQCRNVAVERFSTKRMIEKYGEVMEWLRSDNHVVPTHWQQA